MDTDERKQLGALLREAAKKNRGYASFYDWPDKDAKEVGVCITLFESMKKRGLEPLGKITSRGQGNDPPDCEVVSPDGKVIGIEVTELVCEKAIRKYKTSKIDDWADWDRDRLHQALSDRIVEKDKAKLKGGPYDNYFLIVYTDEPVLQHDKVADLMLGWTPPQTTLIDRVYFLLSYDPRLDRCPYFIFDCDKAPYERDSLPS